MMSSLKIFIISIISIFNHIFILIFGDFYKLWVQKVFNVYNYATKILTFQSSYENLLNDTLLRMERTDEKLTAFHNQLVSVQRIVEELQTKTCTHMTQCPPIPPPLPPPLPPSLPLTQSSWPDRVSGISSKKGFNARVNQINSEDCSHAKKQRPSIKELVQRKEQLKVTSIQRSPGGTPLTHRKIGEIYVSSPEDNAIANVMKKALKRKFKNFRPISPVSPIEGSLNDQDFSF